MSLSVEVAICQLFVSILMMVILLIVTKLMHMSSKVLLYNNGILAVILLFSWVYVLIHFSFIALMIEFVATLPLCVLELKWVKMTQIEHQNTDQDKSDK